MPRKKPRSVRERTAIMYAAESSRRHWRARRLEPHSNRGPKRRLCPGSLAYGLILWGGTVATVFLQVVASIRQGTVCPLMVVLPVVTFAGMNEGWPGAK